MPKRQSAEITSARASAMSRRVMANKLAISFRLVLCGLSQPFASHCFKVMLGPHQEDLGRSQHGAEKVVLVPHALSEFRRRQGVGGYFPPQPVAHARQQGTQ